MGSNIEPREASTCETHTSSPARRSSNERAASFVFEGASRWVAYKEFRRAIGSRGYFEALRESKNPPRFVVLLEDSVALIGPAIALAGTFAAVQWQAPVLDGLASIAIGVLLAATASLMARETKYLRIGVPAHPAIARSAFASPARSRMSVQARKAPRPLLARPGPKTMFAFVPLLEEVTDIAQPRSA
jgi:hypothetical protein